MRPRTLLIALAVSLVVNVFVIGAAIGVVFGRGLGPQPGPAQRPNAIMAAADRLDPADRAAFRAMMQDEVQREGPTQLDARMARRQVVAILSAPTFDRAAAGAALDKARADDIAVRKAVEDDMLDFAAQLDLQGRTALAEGLGRGPAWMGRPRAAQAAANK